MTAFQKGDTVRAQVTAQGMTEGVVYIVTDVLRGPFGLVTYEICGRTEESKPFQIGNGHLLLKRVEAR